MNIDISEDWRALFGREFTKPYFLDLVDFVDSEYENGEVFPPKEQIFSAFDYCSFQDLKVVIIGQDPYHDVGQAHGLSFSVGKEVKIPPSLRNIFKELHDDIGRQIPSHGDLSEWARQGVLLLNATLTVRAHTPNSHQRKGWEQFTDAVIKSISNSKEGIIFLLWGAYAQQKSSLIDESKHYVLKSTHPSPLSAYRGFFGCRHFSKTNKLLIELGQDPITW